MLIGFAACGPLPNPDAPAPGELAASDKQRIVAAAPQGDLQQAVRGQTEFAVDLYKRLGSQDQENLFLSPYSIAVALSMTYAGAEGDTAKAFDAVLHSGLAEPAHHRAMNDLDAQLASRGTNAKGTDGNPFRLKSVNQLFAQQGYGVEAPFLDTLALEYGANVRLLDFSGATEPSRVAINDWVEQRTENRIQDLLAPGIIKEDTRLVLVNAIYFNAAWAKTFEESLTQPGAFNLLSGGQKTVPFMSSLEMPARAAQVNGVEVFELAYDGNELSMLVMVPPQGQFQAFEQALSAQVVEQHVAALKAELLELKLPKFETRSSKSLSQPLKDAGLGIAFSESADFSRITQAERLAITDVVHQAFVKVNEKGTEAAAATAVVIGPTSVPVTRPVVVDRPFVFAIRDNATGALVFLGRITEP